MSGWEIAARLAVAALALSMAAWLVRDTAQQLRTHLRRYRVTRDAGREYRARADAELAAARAAYQDHHHAPPPRT